MLEIYKHVLQKQIKYLRHTLKHLV